jgi:alpha-galactosidase
MRQFPVLLATLLLAACALALDNGVGLTPPLGWSTWCSQGPCGVDYCTEHEVLTTMEAMMANGMQAAGYHWMLLDDCWAAGNRTASGELTWDTNRFPNGIPSLVKKIHQHGFKLGIYTSAGNATCDNGGRPYPIPGSEGHYQLDMNTFASWEVDYVKVDWCGDVHNLPLDGIAVGAKDYRAVSAAITNTTPARAMYLEGVAAYIFLLFEAGEYVNAWRASSDHHDNWHNTLEVILTAYGIDIGHPGPGKWAFMDVLMTGGQGCKDDYTAHCPGMTDVEYRTEFTLWSLMQSPLIVSTNVRNMTSIMNETLFNKHLLSIHQDTRTPPGKSYGFPQSCGGKWGNLQCSLYARPLHDGSALMVMFNAGEEGQDISFDLSKVWSNATAASGIDVWSGKQVTSENGAYRAYVEAHGVVAVHLTPQ